MAGKSQSATSEKENFVLCQDITSMSCAFMNFLLCQFVLKWGEKIRSPTYSPSSSYRICCDLLWSLKFDNCSDVNFFTDPVFALFKSTLDAVLKELHTRPELLPAMFEDQVWLQGVLRVRSLQTLLDTMKRIIVDFAIIHHNCHLLNHQHNFHILGMWKMLWKPTRVGWSIRNKGKRSRALCQHSQPKVLFGKTIQAV